MFQPPALPVSPNDDDDGDLEDDSQDAPGADYDLFEEDEEGEDNVDLPPDYFYEEYYYNTYGVGARAIADYAPPGYEARDYQDAPGMPEFRRITPPPRPTAKAADDVAHLVTRGMYPGSFLVPGVDTSFRLRGFVRLAALYDFDPIGSTDSFVPNTIPVPQEDGQNFNMSARISRFALESWTPTKFCDWNVHTFIEGDFFNGPAQGAGGGGNPFRLRHAFFDFGYFRFGQQNSVFMDGTNWASLVDFQGPNSWTNQRQPSARMTLPIIPRWYWATSVERPFSDITTNGLGTNVQNVPDFATHLRYETDVGHLQAATVIRTIGFRPSSNDDTRYTGVGFSGNAVFHPWAILTGTDPVHEENPSGLTRSRILLQTTFGPGVGRYINDLAGQGFDAQVDPLTGNLALVDATGWNASYEHWFNACWFSTHLDTVPLCAGAKPKRDGERIVTDGTTALGGDNRTGCAVLVAMVETLLKHKLPHPPITLLFTVREESGLHGARELGPADLSGATMCFNVDGRLASELITGAVGQENWDVEIKGKASHAGVAPEKGISATLVGAIGLTEAQRSGWFGKVVKPDGNGTSNVGIFGGKEGHPAGDATNVVTDYVHIKGEARSPDAAFATAITRGFEEAFEQARQQVRDDSGETAKVNFEHKPAYPPFTLADDSPVIQHAKRAVESIGLKPTTLFSNGGLDANWLDKHGVPTVTIGAGQYEIHTVKEYVDLPEFAQGCRLAVALATLEI